MPLYKKRHARIPTICVVFCSVLLASTARSWWLDRDIPEARFKDLDVYPIWLADFSKSYKAIEKPGVINARAQNFWQFADDAKMVFGFRGGLDAGIFYGTREEFNKAFGPAQ